MNKIQKKDNLSQLKTNIATIEAVAILQQVKSFRCCSFIPLFGPNKLMADFSIKHELNSMSKAAREAWLNFDFHKKQAIQ